MKNDTAIGMVAGVAFAAVLGILVFVVLTVSETSKPEPVPTVTVTVTATPVPIPVPEPSNLQLPDPVEQYPVLTIPPCVMEDDENCYWDASVRGNGVGTSFINIDGVYYYPVTK